MKIFAIADLHLSFDENIDKPMDKFGPGWDLGLGSKRERVPGLRVGNKSGTGDSG